MFEVGQEVVCVDAKPWPGSCAIESIVEGKTYRVERVWFEPDAETVLVSLVDVNCEQEMEYGGFGLYRFRPVARTRDTLSIESFMTIKTGQPEEPRRVVGPVSPEREGV